MPRTIYLAIFSNGSRRAHHSIFIPTIIKDTTNISNQVNNSKSTNDREKDKSINQSTGKVIHVTGNRATGFFLEFKRNYDIAADDRKYELIALSEVDDKYVKDTLRDGKHTLDTIAHDRLETIATMVTPPGPSANPFNPEARSCQHWMQDYIAKLVEEGILSDDAIKVLAEAPKVI